MTRMLAPWVATSMPWTPQFGKCCRDLLLQVVIVGCLMERLEEGTCPVPAHFAEEEHRLLLRGSGDGIVLDSTKGPCLHGMWRHFQQTGDGEVDRSSILGLQEIEQCLDGPTLEPIPGYSPE